MLARYRIVRGKRPPGEPLPNGTRYDTRKHTRHVLRPTEAMVEQFLADPSEQGFRRFRRAYLEELGRRFTQQREAFDALADEARREAVYLGCNCPTARQPEVQHCHTWLALEFFARNYPELEVVFDRRAEREHGP